MTATTTTKLTKNQTATLRWVAWYLTDRQVDKSGNPILSEFAEEVVAEMAEKGLDSSNLSLDFGQQ